MWAKIVIMVLFITYLANVSKGALRTYKRSYDIYDRENWETGQIQECDGLVIPQHVMGLITAKKLELKQLVLGNDITFFFNDDTDIIFDENSDSPFNCVKLNSTTMRSHYWNDVNNWITRGEEENEAVPHIERLPCEHDDVVFPKGILTGRVFIDNGATVKSLKFGTEQWSTDDFLEHDRDPLLKETLSLESGDLNIRNEQCTDESGCDCGNEIPYRNFCDYVHQKESYDCVDPIQPIGFCNKICGASIVFQPYAGFKIADIQDKLKRYASHTHVSKITNDEGEGVIQIIFTEKEFTGNSLVDAKELYEALIKEKNIYPHNAEFHISGNYLERGDSSNTVLPLIFGSLVAACLAFGLIFFIFGEDGRFNDLRQRFGMGSRPLSYRTVLFSKKLSVSEGTGLILDGQSVSGSIPNIPKSFDNPMFAELVKKSPSTSESSDSSVEEVNGLVKPKINEKPEPEMFEDQERRNLIENVAEEGELVDLSEII